MSHQRIGFGTSSRQTWASAQRIAARSYRCGHCGYAVCSELGYKLAEHKDGSGEPVGGIYICVACQGPTIFYPDGRRLPGEAFGRAVAAVPPDVANLYDEARRCLSEDCTTAAVLLCRKILMHLGVTQGANANLPFVDYVSFLAERGFVPPNGRGWVDLIRRRGNEANHELRTTTEPEAKELLQFLEMLLIFIFGFPARMVDSQNDPASAL